MTLTPNRSAKAQLMAEKNLELSVEQLILSQLDEIRKSGEELKGQVRDFRTILMGAGTTDVETPHGRLPMVEKRVTDLEMKVELLDSTQSERKGERRIFNLIGGAAAGSLGAIITWIANLTFHIFVRH